MAKASVHGGRYGKEPVGLAGAKQWDSDRRLGIKQISVLAVFSTELFSILIGVFSVIFRDPSRGRSRPFMSALDTTAAARDQSLRRIKTDLLIRLASAARHRHRSSESRNVSDH